ncbi:MAG TPA: VOC family protein [Acidimicrobiia bacterium]|jgi:uncharacterized glyoxalase superfamily protein PhnB
MPRDIRQRIGPVLIYDDAPAAIEYLTKTFGFEELAVHEAPDGSIAHAELTYLGSVIGLSDRGTGPDRSIFDLGPCCVYVTVDDADAHHDAAVAAGADVIMELEDQDYGSRDYAVRDPEGFVWAFGTYAPGEHV